MNEGSAAAKKTPQSYTKEIPLKNIKWTKETNPRLEIDQQHILTLEEQYQAPSHKIPPLQVLLVQSGDPKTCVYLILDGIHRFSALKRIKGVTEAMCNVQTEPCYTIEDLELGSVQDAVRALALPYNIYGNKALTREERKAAAKAFDRSVYSIKQISDMVGMAVRTVQRLFQEETSAKRGEIKDEIMAKLRQGVMVRKLAKQYNGSVSETTIINWKRQIEKDAKKGTETPIGVSVPFLAGDSDRPKLTLVSSTESLKLFPGRDPLPGLSPYVAPSHTGPSALTEQEESKEPIEVPDKDFHETVEKLNKICLVFDSLPWFPDATDIVITQMLTRLRRKDARLAQALGPEGIEHVYQTLLSDYETLKADFEDTRKTSFERAARIEQLEAQLSSRKAHCDNACSHSKEQASIQMNRAISFLLDSITEQKNALENGQYPIKVSVKGSSKGSKKFIAIDENSKELVRQAALRFTYAAIGQYDFAVSKQFVSAEVAESFSKFLSLIEELEFDKIADINSRIRHLDKELSLQK